MMKGDLHKPSAYITNIINPYTDLMTVTSLVASLQHKTSVAIFCPWQIALDKKFSCIVYAKLC